MATACAVARIALWSGFWNSDRRLIRCTTMGAIARQEGTEPFISVNEKLYSLHITSLHVQEEKHVTHPPSS